MGRGTRSEPACVRLTAGLDDLLSDPLQLLLGARVGRQRDEPVDQLGHAQALQLAPDRDPRRRWLTRKPVAQQHPIQPRVGCNHGYNARTRLIRKSTEGLDKGCLGGLEEIIRSSHGIVATVDCRTGHPDRMPDTQRLISRLWDSGTSSPRIAG